MAWLHTWAGLLTGWLLYFVFIIGTFAYVNREVTRWMIVLPTGRESQFRITWQNPSDQAGDDDGEVTERLDARIGEPIVIEPRETGGGTALCGMHAFAHTIWRSGRQARGRLELTIAAAIARGLLPIVNALTTEGRVGVTIPAGDSVLASIDLGMHAAWRFFALLGFELRAFLGANQILIPVAKTRRRLPPALAAWVQWGGEAGGAAA